ncbi:MAG: ribonuclease HI family protein [Candidatus Omnitrophica bacterium]|nr:ribonuclease HI family protein [Candidatus Omnitrophota bacterium]
MFKLELFIDGACQGNPGPSGAGVVIRHNGKIIKEISRYIGSATNNIAEYTALIFGLQESLILKAESVKINTDSELLYRQLIKVYKVKHPNIVKLYDQAVHLADGFKEFSISRIPRELNTEADKLATKAIKEKFKDKS